MSNIKLGQLVRIEAFHKADAAYQSPKFISRAIGQTGRFVVRENGISFGSSFPGTFCGEFEYDPDLLGHNSILPCFVAVYVEPVEEENER